MHASPSASLDELQKIARHLGRVFTFFGAVMSGTAGWYMGGESLLASVVLAGVFAALTVAVAILLNFVDTAWKSGETALAAGLGAFFALAAVGELGSHIAFQTGHRSNDIAAARLQTTRHDNSGENVNVLKRELARLEAKYDWSKSYGTPESYEPRIKDAEGKVAYETSRGGCKKRCEDFKSAAASLRAEQAIAADRIATADEIKQVKAQYAEAMKVAGITKEGESLAANQAGLIATMATGSLAPAATAVQWANIGMGAYVSLLSTFLGTIFNFLGFHQFGRRRPEDDTNSEDKPAGSFDIGDTLTAVMRAYDMRKANGMAGAAI